MSNTEPQRPINPLPPVVVALFIIIMGVEAIFSLGARGIIGGPGAIGWRNMAIQDYGFNSQIMSWMLNNDQYPIVHLRRLVTYIFVHGSFTHALFAGVMLLSLGKFVGEVFSQWATFCLFILSAIAGALIYGLVVNDQPWLIGAFPGVYGLIGGFTYLIWLKLGQVGAQQSRAFTLIGFLMGVQLIFGLIYGSNSEWLADIAGFFFGFVLSFFLSPGGFARLRAKIRHR